MDGSPNGKINKRRNTNVQQLYKIMFSCIWNQEMQIKTMT